MDRDFSSLQRHLLVTCSKAHTTQSRRKKKKGAVSVYILPYIMYFKNIFEKCNCLVTNRSEKSNSIFAEIGTQNTLKFLSLPFRQY